MKKETWLTKTEASELAGVSMITINSAIQQNLLITSDASNKSGKGTRCMIYEPSLLKWMKCRSIIRKGILQLSDRPQTDCQIDKVLNVIQEIYDEGFRAGIIKGMHQQNGEK